MKKIYLDNYILQTKITEGKFGSVYRGKHRYTGDLVAIKCELVTSSSKTIKHESKIYLKIGNEPGFPRLKWFGKLKDTPYLFLVIDLLGPSLRKRIEIKEYNNNHFISIASQMFRLCEVLHSKGLIHRDIKPDNFLFGRKEQDTETLYLADFGLCTYIEKNISKVFNTNVSPQPQPGTLKNVIGSPNYVSLNVHKLVEPGMRDDLESCVYVLLFLLNSGRPLWTDCSTIEDIQQQKEKLLNCLHQFISDASVKLCTNTNTNHNLYIHICYNLLNYIRQLEFHISPNYTHIYNIINSTNKTI